MTTATEMQALVDRWIEDVERQEQFVNGTAAENVVLRDGRQLKTMAKLEAEAQLNVDVAVAASTNATNKAALATGASATAIAAAEYAQAALALNTVERVFRTYADVAGGIGALTEGDWFLVYSDQAPRAGQQSLYSKTGGVATYEGPFISTVGSIVSKGDSGVRYSIQLPPILDGAGKDNSSPFNIGISRNNFPANHEGSGAPYFYTDDVGFLVMNGNQDRGRTNVNIPGIGQYFETQFWFAGRFNTEWQLVNLGMDGSTRRIAQTLAPANGTDRDAAEWSFGVDKLNFYDFFGGIGMQWNLRTGINDHNLPVLYRFAINGVPVASQMNAAGNARKNLPFYTSADRLVLDGPTNQRGASNTGGLLGEHCLQELWDTTPVNGSRFARRIANPVTGAYTFDDDSGTTTGLLTGQSLRNLGAGGVRHFMQSSVGGDAYYVTHREGADSYSWSFGMRFDDGAFIIANTSTGLGLKPAITIARDTQIVSFPKAVKLASATVGTLPTPSGSLIGAMVNCTNARNAGEAEGAGTGSPVVCQLVGGSHIWQIPGIAGAATA